MLFIKRKIGESIHVNNDVQFTVISIQGKTVTLGAVYSPNNEVWRGEIFQKIQREREMAGNSAGGVTEINEPIDYDEACCSGDAASLPSSVLTPVKKPSVTRLRPKKA